VEDFLHEEAVRVSVPLETGELELRAWRYDVKGVRGFEVPVYFWMQTFQIIRIPIER